MNAQNLSAAIIQAKQAVARHESQNTEDPFHFELTDHRYVALRDLLDALSTPPADGVRETARTFAEGVGWAWESLAPMWQERFEQAARTVLAMPRGTVTDAEVEAAWLAWDAVSVDDDPNGWLSIRAALEAAREARS